MDGLSRLISSFSIDGASYCVEECAFSIEESSFFFSQVRGFYREHQGEHFFKELVQFMTSGTRLKISVTLNHVLG